MAQIIDWSKITPQNPTPPEIMGTPVPQVATPEQEYPQSEMPMVAPEKSFVIKSNVTGG